MSEDKWRKEIGRKEGGRHRREEGREEMKEGWRE